MCNLKTLLDKYLYAMNRTEHTFFFGQHIYKAPGQC